MSRLNWEKDRAWHQGLYGEQADPDRHGRPASKSLPRLRTPSRRGDFSLMRANADAACVVCDRPLAAGRYAKFNRPQRWWSHIRCPAA